jgi:hypothetical protein
MFHVRLVREGLAEVRNKKGRSYWAITDAWVSQREEILYAA